MKRLTLFAIFLSLLLLVGLSPGEAAAGTLTGKVTDKNNISIANVIIEAQVGGSTVATATSDTHGDYTINPVDDGTYTVTATPPPVSGFAPAVIPNVVVAGATIRDIVLVKEALILSGTVTDSTTGNPVEGVRVRVWGPGINTTDDTDADGDYAFLVESGTYSVRTRKTGYEDTQINDVEILENTENFDIEITPVAASDVTVRILKEDGTPLRDSTCTSVRVSLKNLDTDHSYGPAYSDANGRITIENVEHGRISISFGASCSLRTDDDGDDGTPPEVFTSRLSANGRFDHDSDRDLGDFIIPLVDVTYEVVSEHGDPVNGARIDESRWYTSMANPVFGDNIQFSSFSGQMQIFSTGSDNTATLALPATCTEPTTSVDLWVFPGGGNTSVARKQFTDQTWTEDTTLTFELPSTTTFSGTVMRSDTGAGARGLRISLSGNGYYTSSIIGADGSFSMQVPPGSYHISIQEWLADWTNETDGGRGRAYINVSSTTEIDLQGAVEKHFVIPLDLSASTTIVNTAGEAVNDVNVYADSYDTADLAMDGLTFRGRARVNMHTGTDNHVEGIPAIAAKDPAMHSTRVRPPAAPVTPASRSVKMSPMMVTGQSP